MKYSMLGKSGLQASQLGMGCSRIASLTTEQSAKVVKTTLLEAFGAGVNFFDTADIYGQGDSERLLGSLFSGERRDQVIYCTKAGLTLSQSQTLVRLVKPVLNPILRRWSVARHRTTEQRLESERQCFEPGYLAQCIHNSLRRLRTDHLDLFMLHSPPVQVVEDDAVRRLLEKFRKDGKASSIGVSCDTVDVAKVALDWQGCDCIQVPVSVIQQDMITEVLPLAAERNVGVIAREPFAGGRVFDIDTTHALGVLSDDRHLVAAEALKYVAGIPAVQVVVARMNAPGHLGQNLRALGFAN